MIHFKKLSRWAAVLGALVVLSYWCWLRPSGTGGRLGYAEDLGDIEMSRQIMADNLQQYGAPYFHSSRVMAPEGTSVAFYSWALERDWLGGRVLLQDRDFPFLWVYLGFSLLLSYFGVGWICRKMGLPAAVAWGLALAVVVFDLPKHFKTYKHYEHLIQHWMYLSVFLDAWIWQRLWRERKWSWPMEAWRGALLIGTFGIGGYYWGGMILEWMIFRACLGWSYWRSRREGNPIQVDRGDLKRLALPTLLGLSATILVVRWLLPLVQEALKLGKVDQAPGWTAAMLMVFRPAWLDPALGLLAHVSRDLTLAVYRYLSHLRLVPIEEPETVVTIGWFYWIPFFISLVLLRKKRGGPGLGAVRPHLVFLVAVLLYLGTGAPWQFQHLVQHVVPFMEFFRVVSRMGLFLCPLLGALLALAWPELSRWVVESWRSSSRKRAMTFRAVLVLFVVSSVAEVTLLSTPVTAMPPMSEGLSKLLENVRTSPGDTVLDLPFCVAGGNGICTAQQCPNYPDSTAPSYLTMWHDKKIYGVYEARLVPAQCEIYDKMPYQSWFDAWSRQRCLIGPEWDDFCHYLDSRKELAAVLVYPGIWRGADTPECRAQFAAHLGPALEHAELPFKISRGARDLSETSIERYAPRCLANGPMSGSASHEPKALH